MGRFGDNNTVGSNIFVPITNNTHRWREISIPNPKTAFGIVADGTLWAWGLNQNGEFGNNTNTPILVTLQISPESWKQICGSYNIIAGIKEDGTLWEWSGGSRQNMACPTTSVLKTEIAAVEKTITVYPNPAQDFLYVHVAKDQK